ncbi:MFS transporter [Hamadaea tsunoensis]|uniref:MFS transporter n=1 Tax=Hamadaea tsunoensis TaxID=53368 RepID=UPI00040BCBB2|nr:MFS transporter [Hamadaea tsunoensis]
MLRRLLAATTIDSFGSWLLVFALPLEVYRRTGSAMSTGVTLALQAAPAVLWGPWAGTVVDRFDRRRLLVAANLVAAAGVALLLTDALYLGILVESAAVCLLQPALRSVTPVLAGSPERLGSANAYSAFAGSAFRMVGPLAGTLLPFGTAVAADLVSYLVSAALLSTVVVPAVARAGPPSIRAGLRFVARTPLLRGLILASWAYWTANAGLTVLLIPRFGGHVGLLIAGLGAGYLAGSALSKIFLSGYATRSVLALAYTMVGLCFLVMFTAPAFVVALAAVTVAGVPGAVATVLTGHRMQTATPDGLRGRVAAAFGASDALAAVAGAVLAPALVAGFGLGGAQRVLSAAILGVAALTALLRPDAAPAGQDGTHGDQPVGAPRARHGIDAGDRPGDRGGPGPGGSDHGDQRTAA